MPDGADLPTITQAQADDAAAAAASFWPTFGRRWPWTRQRSLVPIYARTGELTVALLRAFPAIQWSSQRLWYQRDVRDTPAIYVLFPEVFAEEARPFVAGGDLREIEGKQAVSFIYLVPAPQSDDGGAVAKSLLVSTRAEAPYYVAQLTHELLNCFCDAEWDGQTLRSGIRHANWGAGASLQTGGALNDLLLDTLLLGFLPGAGVTRASLAEGMLAPYWELVRAFAERLAGVPVVEALFAGAESVERFSRALDAALHSTDAAATLDRLLARHDWPALRALVGPPPDAS
ncbi:MAG: hypothetical protein ACHQ4H_12375 [Ktedonobacterales bacterium]